MPVYKIEDFTVRRLEPFKWEVLYQGIPGRYGGYEGPLSSWDSGYWFRWTAHRRAKQIVRDSERKAAKIARNLPEEPIRQGFPTPLDLLRRRR